MSRIFQPRRIIDRAALSATLDRMLEDGAAPQEMRGAFFDLIKASMEAGRSEIRRRLDAGEADGEQSARALAFLADQMIRLIYDFATGHVYPAANPTEGERLCVAAVGGYGRAELAPHSDIDLLFLRPYKITARQEQVIEYVLYMLWDLKLKVGHAVRSIDECLRLSETDLTIRTALLESRYLWGDRPLFDGLRESFRASVTEKTGPEFVEAKLAERDARHRRTGDSRYVLEPDVKEGKGGLRDLQTLYWISKFLYRIDDVEKLVDLGVLTDKEVRRFSRACRFMWNVRCHLHYVAGRGDNRLTFDVQPEIAARLGYRDRVGMRGVERFMKHYYLVAKEIGDLTRIFCAALEAEHKRRPRFRLPSLGRSRRAPDGFVLDGDRLSFAPGRELADDPVKILELFHSAQADGRDIHPNALREVTRNLSAVDAIRNDEAANRLFVEMLTSRNDPETTLRRLSEAGVFGRFVPDFGRVIAQMQHDMYHVYTVDEHTVFAIGILSGIEDGSFVEEMPVASEVVHRIHSRRALYVALLLHDIAKGRGGDHSELGADVAHELCPRFGLSGEETDTVAWLVRYHLLMSNTAFRREINDPQTVADFCAVVQSVERLRLLLVLTVADIRAVGPNVWNGWKAALLRELYRVAEERLTGARESEGAGARVAEAQAAMRDLAADLPEPELEAHVARCTALYWQSFDAETHARHARLACEAGLQSDDLTIRSRVDHGRSATEVTVYGPDHPGLFARITGAMAVRGANIVDAKIYTTSDGMALDTFWIQDDGGGAFDQPERLARLSSSIEEALAGSLRPRDELGRASPMPSRTSVFKVAPRVSIDNELSRTHTVIEVDARDRPGLLYDIARALSSLNLRLSSAHVTTFGETAADVFYVKDIFGLQITHEIKLGRVRETLLAAITDDDPAPGADERPVGREMVADAAE